jgi:hypothetical protein
MGKQAGRARDSPWLAITSNVEFSDSAAHSATGTAMLPLE